MKVERRTLMLVFVLLLLGAGLGGSWFSNSFFIGYDSQLMSRCLSQYWYLGGKSPPNVLNQGDLVWFIGDEQQPEHLRGKRLLKIVAGLPGDRFVVNHDGAFINGVHWGGLNIVKTAKLNESSLYQDVVIPDGYAALMGSKPGSYDSRYFGLVEINRIKGGARALF